MRQLGKAAWSGRAAVLSACEPALAIDTMESIGATRATDTEVDAIHRLQDAGRGQRFESSNLIFRRAPGRSPTFGHLAASIRFCKGL